MSQIEKLLDAFQSDENGDITLIAYGEVKRLIAAARE